MNSLELSEPVQDLTQWVIWQVSDLCQTFYVLKEHGKSDLTLNTNIFMVTYSEAQYETVVI